MDYLTPPTHPGVAELHVTVADRVGASRDAPRDASGITAVERVRDVVYN